MKKLITIDADGTLWYPRETKRNVAPHLIYSEFTELKDYLEHLELIEGVKEALVELKKSGLKLSILSTNPKGPKQGLFEVRAKAEHFGILEFFDDILIAPDYVEGKGEVLMNYLGEQKIQKNEVLHVGDSFRYDYSSMDEIGVECWLIETPYTNYKDSEKRPRTAINGLEDVPDKLDELD